jgi:hypothetical protein
MVNNGIHVIKEYSGLLILGGKFISNYWYLIRSSDNT